MSNTTASTTSLKPDYGLDAPGVQRTLLYGGFVTAVLGRALIYWAAHQSSASSWKVSLGTTLVWSGASCFITGCAMFWGSRVGKLRLRDKILNSITWCGDEQVLDVGCGHGLMLLGAAKRLKTGRATGIDVWSQVDQKDNSIEATMENARREGVADRVEILNADAREMPFSDHSFDVILSSFVIHNISAAEGREKAIREIARVLKPSGKLAIADIHYSGQYEHVLRGLGWKEVSRSFPNFLFVTPTRVLQANKP